MVNNTTASTSTDADIHRHKGDIRGFSGLSQSFMGNGCGARVPKLGLNLTGTWGKKYSTSDTDYTDLQHGHLLPWVVEVTAEDHHSSRTGQLEQVRHGAWASGAGEQWVSDTASRGKEERLLSTLWKRKRIAHMEGLYTLISRRRSRPKEWQEYTPVSEPTTIPSPAPEHSPRVTTI